jgi:hypothetical protein
LSRPNRFAEQAPGEHCVCRRGGRPENTTPGSTDPPEPAEQPQQTFSKCNKGLLQALALADGSNHE